MPNDQGRNKAKPEAWRGGPGGGFFPVLPISIRWGLVRILRFWCLEAGFYIIQWNSVHMWFTAWFAAMFIVPIYWRSKIVTTPEVNISFSASTSLVTRVISRPTGFRSKKASSSRWT